MGKLQFADNYSIVTQPIANWLILDPKTLRQDVARERFPYIELDYLERDDDVVIYIRNSVPILVDNPCVLHNKSAIISWQLIKIVACAGT